ncbi:Ig-like domain-containing protein [Yersinia massiliensis]|uniref:Ig-like domain-containing protein n=2 Tax=Yersiniaceae TaxID=1903411 RepID=UPI001CFC6B7A|nr:Ig-like domain-containing protein [Yersinia massiliensis]MCB5319265.1 Ig-like domain-containing protein [Yersinia massiliensis]MDA5547530.1 Ig-like domain-containing protein [Yersinia massiliensis]UZM77936.1 Ig-like domain-containing protein [Yersinia massiliensis]
MPLVSSSAIWLRNNRQAVSLRATPAGAMGLTVQLTPSVLPAGATDKTGVWTTSDATKATVSSTGLVTRIAVGTATITFTTNDGAKTGTSNITITA